jgi:oxygen-independent coproporphyrinogen-3 oxidase
LTLLYVHVPFCFSRCSYCAFYSKLPSEGDVERYLQGLEAEAKRRLDEPFTPKKLRTVFVGGGNPTMLGVRGLGRFLEILESFVPFDELEEFSFETNPETLSAEVLRVLAAVPNLRLSMGIQRLQDAELAILGRNARMDAVYQALDLAFGVTANVSGDFILGVPGCPSVAPSLSGLLKRFPLKHLSAYFLGVVEDTPMWEAVQAGKLEDPDEIGPEELYQVREALAALGFEHYEISNYALPGFECTHNLGYWLAEDYVGLGPSAVSCQGAERLSNVSDFEAWLAGAKPELEILDFAAQRNEFLMLHLRMLRRGLDLNLFESRFGKQTAEFYATVTQQAKQGNLTIDGNGRKVRLSTSAIAFANSIISNLF